MSTIVTHGLNSAFYITGGFAFTSAAPIATVVITPSGGAGWANPRLSSLTRTRDFPGMREILEQEDETAIRVIVQAMTKGMLN